MAELERSHAQMAFCSSFMQFRMEEQEDRHHRNNLRIHGIPEVSSNSDLRSREQAILNKILERPSTEHIELDRLHQVFLLQGAEVSSPRDVLCRKENILCNAWQSQGAEYEAAKIQILPDLCRQTLG